jgi:hypothetical protein
MLSLDARIPYQVMPVYFNLLNKRGVAVPAKVLESKYLERRRNEAAAPELQFKWW